ncbi:MAG: lactate racemase domain-containing protein [Candidatus Acidiferrales bacterium]
MSLYCAQGGPDRELSSTELKDLLRSALEKLGPRKNVLAVPPDYTRLSSRAGELTRYVWEYLGENLRAVLPAVGTHHAMSPEQIAAMFREIPREIFHAHKWREDVETIGTVPAQFICEQSEGKLNYDWPAQVNRLILRGGFDLILSIGQVVPHEVAGMANYNKNILVGTGGPDSINRSHYLGAVYGMERIMGRADNPVRRVLNYAASNFLKNLPIVYVLTVVGRNASGATVTRGLFIGDDIECFNAASDLSLRVNFTMMPAPIKKAVVYLNPAEYQSTWLGNKAIYRTRMAMADGGELLILAPGVSAFGEDPRIDKLIRNFGYHGTAAALARVRNNPDLAADLGAAAHVIHGSSEGRFRIVWSPGHLTREEIQDVGYGYADLNHMLKHYIPSRLKQGWNNVAGENFYFIENPGLGLWASQDRF